MRANLSYYLEKSDHFDEVSIAELEHQILTYPFNQTLKILLAKKLGSAVNQSIEHAAVATGDRSFLNTIMYRDMNYFSTGNDSKPGSVDIHANPATPYESEEYVDTLNELPIESTEIIISETSEPETALDVFHNTDISFLNKLTPETQEGSMLNEQENIESEIDPNIENISGNNQNSVIENAESTANETAGLNPSIGKNKGKSKLKKKKKKKNKFSLDDFSGTSDYVQWLFKLSGKHSQLKSGKKEKKKTDESVKKSITKSDTIISEPLADILAAQGHIADAVKMYQQLILKFPEKSSYFAPKIDKLLNKPE